MRSLLFGSRLPSYPWEEAIRTANYISNRVPTKALYRMTPYERYCSLKLDLSLLRIFGSTAYIHVHRSSKLEPKAIPIIFIGYDDKSSKAYRCFDHTRWKIILIFRDVLVDENKIGIPDQKDPPSGDDDFFQSFLHLNTLPQSSNETVAGDIASPLPEQPSLDAPTSLPPLSHSPNPDFLSQSPLFPTHSISSYLPVEEPTYTDSSLSAISPLLPRRSSRLRRPSVRLDDYVLSIDEDNFDVCLAEHSPDLMEDNLTFE
jgi:hypothetical protein